MVRQSHQRALFDGEEERRVTDAVNGDEQRMVYVQGRLMLPPASFEQRVFDNHGMEGAMGICVSQESWIWALH